MSTAPTIRSARAPGATEPGQEEAHDRRPRRPLAGLAALVTLAGALVVAVWVLAEGPGSASKEPGFSEDPTLAATVPGVDDLALAWSDDFDGGSLDERKWSTKEPWHGPPRFQNDSDAWLPHPPSADNLVVEEGAVRLRARREGGDMTTAMLTTRDKYDSFTHGVVEARVKLPDGAGLWPAFWLLGNGSGARGWPMTGEIDIFEFVNQAGNGYGRMYSSVHWEDGGHRTATESVPTDVLGDDRWHTFALHRSPDFLRFYLDGVQVAELSPGEEVEGYDTVPEGSPIFEDPMHVRLSLEVGGSWAGQGLETAEYEPGELAVDWVRVWE